MVKVENGVEGEEEMSTKEQKKSLEFKLFQLL